MKKLFLLLAIVSLLPEGCKKDEYPKTVEIKYTVDEYTATSGIASWVSYCNELGDTATINSVPLPFVVKFQKKVNRNDTIFLSALYLTDFGMYIEIDINGVKVARKDIGSFPQAYGDVKYIFP